MRYVILALVAAAWSAAPAQQPAELYRASVAAAEGALRAYDTRAAREWLDLAPANARGWEWRRYDRILRDAERVIRLPEGTQIWAVEVSPDGRTVAVGTSTGDVLAYSLRENEPARTIGRGLGFVYDVVFAEDGRRVAAASADRKIRVWRLADGSLEREVATGTRRPLAIAFDRNEDRIAAALSGGAVGTWNARTGDSLRTFLGHVPAPPVPGVTFLPDGRLVSGSWDNTVRVWDQATGQSIRTLGPGYGGTGVLQRYSDVDADPSGRYITGVGSDGIVHVWATTDWSERAFRGHTQDIPAVAISGDGELLATGSVDQTVRLWRVSDGALLGTWLGHEGAVQAVAISRDGSTVVSAGDDGTVRVWNVSATSSRLLPHARNPYTVAWRIDGARLATAAHDGKVRVYDAATRVLVGETAVHSAAVIGLLYTRAGRLVVQPQRGPVRIWDIDSGKPVAVLADTTLITVAMALTPDESRLVTAMSDGSLRVWDAATGKLLSMLARDTARTPTSLTLVDGGQVAVTGWSDGSVTSRRVATGDSIAGLRLPHGRITSAIADRRARHAVLATDAGFIVVWDGRSLAARKIWRGHDAPITGVAISPDGTRIVTVGGDRMIRAWDAARLESVATIRDVPAYCAGFSPDGATLAVCTLERHLLLLDTHSSHSSRQ